jgi:hypothetical protein
MAAPPVAPAAAPRPRGAPGEGAGGARRRCQSPRQRGRSCSGCPMTSVMGKGWMRHGDR